MKLNQYFPSSVDIVYLIYFLGKEEFFASTLHNIGLMFGTFSLCDVLVNIEICKFYHLTVFRILILNIF
jgi:hypothetical protein